MKLTVQQSTIDLVASFEGLILHPYQDTGGKWTIGYGATYINGVPVSAMTPPITLAQADDLLKQQIQYYADMVNHYVGVSLSQHHFDALVSLCYNIGAGNFSNSTVCKDVNAKNMQGAADAFLLWDKVKGVTSIALLNRRKKERAIFLEQ